MLGKLLKHEMKVMSKRFLPLMGIVLAFGIVDRVLLSSASRGFGSGILNNELGALFFAIFQFVFMILVITLSVITLITCIQRFQQHILGDEGYLTMTLPVDTWMLVLVKALIATFWTIINGITVLFAIFLASSGDDANFWREFAKLFSLGFGEIASHLEIPTGLFVFEVIASTLILTITAYLMIYLSIVIGQRFRKFRKIGAFLSYFVLSTLLMVVVGQVMYFFTKSIYQYSGSTQNLGLLVHRYMLMSVAVMAVIGGISLLVTSWQLRTKLDLE